jgi:hypothetical protein
MIRNKGPTGKSTATFADCTDNATVGIGGHFRVT